MTVFMYLPIKIIILLINNIMNNKFGKSEILEFRLNYPTNDSDIINEIRKITTIC